MGTINSITIMGNLGIDPEYRKLESGQDVTNFTVATNEGYKDRDGNWVDRPEWHRIVIWGKDAITARDHLKKGRPILIEGRMQTRKWEDRDGNTRYTSECVCRRMTFVPKDGTATESGGNTQHSQPSKQVLDDDDIPF